MTHYGPPQVLTIVETPIPTLQAGQILVKVKAIGVNYADLLRRQNTYFMPTPLPYVLGTEAVGVIEATAPDISQPFTQGTRVLVILPAGGGYAEYVTTSSTYCVPLPDSIDDYSATAIFVQGTTAQLMMARLTGQLAGKTVLINAAAGGVGSLLVQLAKLNGARVIAASSSADKLRIAHSLGADVTIDYTLDQWGKQVRQATDDQGVDYAFEMVGGEVYNQSVKALAQGGNLILYGCASGVQGSVHPEYFVDQNISQTGFNLAYYLTKQTAHWQQALSDVMNLMGQGQLHVETPRTFGLAQAWEAHQAIEARQTMGKVVLTTAP